MIIKSINIRKFRGFENVKFDLGTHLTVIAGQNGTQKTTILGMLSQPFSISEKGKPLSEIKPLCGGNYKSGFAEKFKLSEKFDRPKLHEWTLTFFDSNLDDFTVESIRRSKESDEIRFWKKGDRTKGSGYVQRPVIYLSLSRLFPIGEDNKVSSSKKNELSIKEFDFYKRWHNKILCIPDVELDSADYLTGNKKTTLGANTSFYDWRMNSAGQDNIGKILLAIISFRRLKEDCVDSYKGGLLVIDELDATLYPASQIKLLSALRKFASDYNIQIIVTSHSLTIINEALQISREKNTQMQIKVIYLQKKDNKIEVIENPKLESIQNNLNVLVRRVKPIKKVPVICEDKEAQIFLKGILKRRTKKIDFTNCDFSLGCNNLIELAQKVRGFKFPDSVIILDGDIKDDKAKRKKIRKLKNVLVLPGNDSPERILAHFLYNLSDCLEIWDQINSGYSKQFVFKNFSFNEVIEDRNKAKKWFIEQKDYWGRNCFKIINPWINNNRSLVDNFINEFDTKITEFEKLLGI